MLGSAAFKTRFARWLAKSSVKERNALIRNAPILKNVFDRIFGKSKEKTSEKEILKALEGIQPGLSIKDVSSKHLKN